MQLYIHQYFPDEQAEIRYFREPLQVVRLTF